MMKRKQELMRRYDTKEITMEEFMKETEAMNTETKNQMKAEEVALNPKKEITNKEDLIIDYLEKIYEILSKQPEARIGINTKIIFEILQQNTCNSLDDVANELLKRIPTIDPRKAYMQVRTMIYNVANGKIERYREYTFDKATFKLVKR
jgi:hypothetical protein